MTSHNYSYGEASIVDRDVYISRRKVVRIDKILHYIQENGSDAQYFYSGLGKDGKRYVIKHIVLSGDYDKMTNARQEAYIMQQLRKSRYTLTLSKAAFAGPNKKKASDCFILTPYYDQSLDQLINERTLRDVEALNIFCNVCQAVSFMHSRNPAICHRDIKAENVVRRPSINGRYGNWVLSGFGSAVVDEVVLDQYDDIQREEKVIQARTPPAQRAPEMYNLQEGTVIGPPADMWALGCLLYVIVFGGKKPFGDDRRGCQLQILQGDYEIEGKPMILDGKNKQIQLLFTDLIQGLLNVDVYARFTITQVLDRISGAAGKYIDNSRQLSGRKR